jgi:4-hydroxy-L-threonine phosphate dehydrogenase PdxA
VNYKPIIIVAGEPNSIFFELFFKVIKKKIRSPIILIASKKLIIKQAKILKKKIDFSVTNEFEIVKKKN